MKKLLHAIGRSVGITAFVFFAGCDRSNSPAPPADATSTKPCCLVLEHPGAVMAPREVYQPIPLLARELLRQSLLISARDELSLSTRDPILRERGGAPGKGDPILRLCMTHQLPDNRHVAYSIRRKDGTKWAALLNATAPFAREQTWDYVALVDEAERLSRTTFCQLLRDVGISGNPPPVATDLPIPADLDNLLWSLNAIDQYAAVRALHGLMRTRGESSQILGGLARGYANLGILTEMHWNISHKAFKARALLYAQRLMVHDADGPFARAHRAYALALAGLHKDGLADVAEAKKQVAGSSTRPAVAATSAPAARATPAWLDMIEAACQVDSARLMEQAEAHLPYSGWAFLIRVLQFDVGRLSTPDGDLVMRLVTEYPVCLRAVSLLNSAGLLGHAQMAGPAAFQQMDSSLRERLPSVPGLPAEVLPLIARLEQAASADRGLPTDDPRTPALEIMRSLVRAGEPRLDRGEPSWTILGHLLEEEYFDHAQQRAFYYKKQLGVDSAPFVEWAMGLVPDHPYRGHLDLYRYRQGRELGEGLENVKQIRCVDLDSQLEPVFNWFDYFNRGGGKTTSAPTVYALAQAGYDRVVRIDHQPQSQVHDVDVGVLSATQPRNSWGIDEAGTGVAAESVCVEQESISRNKLQVTSHTRVRGPPGAN